MDKSKGSTNALGDYVLRKRQQAGLSLRQLEERAGVDHTWISHVERGDYTNPDARSLAKLARGLEVEVSDLYLAAGYAPGDGLPGIEPYLRAKYDYLPETAVEQLRAHFELINDKYRQDHPEGAA